MTRACVKYCCLPFLVLLMVAHNSDAQELKIPDSPVAVASMGAAVCDGYLYHYGGNAGVAHSFSKEGQNNVLRRVKLESGSEWEELGKGPRRQGNVVVAYKGKIYRLGGFEATNSSGEDENLISSDEFVVFDPATKKWTALANLPSPRSSFDGVVVGDWLYVIGGWALNGEDGDAEWQETALKINLSKSDSKWEEMKEPPFVRRANSVAVHDGMIYSIGGMGMAGGPTTKVAVYDPKKDSWSDGPNLPGDPMQGFGTSSFNVGGNLVISTLNGQVLKISDDGKKWDKIHQMESGRFFHRLVAVDDHRFLIMGGAASRSGKKKSVLVFDLNQFKSEGTGSE